MHACSALIAFTCSSTLRHKQNKSGWHPFKLMLNSHLHNGKVLDYKWAKELFGLLLEI